jgi:hypothetical protein
MYILVDASLYVFGSHHVLKKAFHVDTYEGFLQLSGGEKAIFLASVYL